LDYTYNEGWKKLKKLRAVKDNNRDFNFDIVMANPPFAGDIKEGRIITKYELGKKSKDNYQSKIGRDILFIERNLQFLKPGGRMAIILPQGRFNNSSDKYIRDFIAERCRILAVVGLHGNVFKPHTGTKTSVLFVQKWDDELCPQRDDYPIFFATMQKPSKDNSGEKIYVLNDKGEFLRDKNKHVIVDHDLFNHDGLTRDGIAEAFIEFAKKENLSFFDSSSFDETKYKNLLKELECTEIFLSSLNDERRIDAEYFYKKYLSEEVQTSKFENKSIGNLAFVTDGQHGYHEIDETSNVHMLTAKNAKNWFADIESAAKVAKWVDDDNKRSSLKINDIILSTRGTIGYCALVFEDILPANLDQDVARIKIENNFISPEFLLTYLNSKFGQDYMQRNKTGMVQQGLSLEKVRSIPIPILHKSFQEKISENVKSAHEKLKLADKKYKSAEQILSAELGLENFEPPKDNVSVKSFSASFGKTGRLDAEFYQPKYDALKNLLDSLTTRRLGEIVEIFKSIEPGSEFYGNKGIPFIRVSDVNKFGINEPEIKLSEKIFANYRSYYPREDTILFSKDGSVGIAYKVRADMKAITSGALLHLTIKNLSEILPDYLALVLNSKVVQMQAERDSSGAIIKHWKPSEIEKVVVPVINVSIQEKIAAQVEESFVLRSESKRLLEVAKRAVEVAIEDGEDAAEKFIESN